MKKRLVYGMTSSECQEYIDKTTNRYLYLTTAIDVFNDQGGDPIITKSAFLELYDTWDDDQKEQIEMLLKIRRCNAKHSIMPGFGIDQKGEYIEHFFEMDDVTHVIKVYGSQNFFFLLDYNLIDGIYDRADFTLEELHQEALKAG